MAQFQRDNLWVGRLSEDVCILHFDVVGNDANVLSLAVLDDLDAALDHIQSVGPRLVIFRSGKKHSFLAGIDPRELAKLKTSEEALHLAQRGQELTQRLSEFPIPTVAMIGGSCLSAGLELVLVCDYRIVIDDGSTELGLLQLDMGLIPGWGGTLRLPRLVGLETSLRLILSGRRLGAVEAVRCGLADALVETSDSEPPGLLASPEKRHPEHLPLRGWKQFLIESNPLGRWLLFRGSERVLRKYLHEEGFAHWDALTAIRTGLNQGNEAGLAIERETFARLALTPACQNLIHHSIQREEARKPPKPVAGESAPIRKIGIIGAGDVGAGFAQLAAIQGCEVILHEKNKDTLGWGILRIITLLNQAVKHGKLEQEVFETIISRIRGYTGPVDFAHLDLLLEAGPEDIEAKTAVLTDLEEELPRSTLIASTTVASTIGEIQQSLEHPQRMAGLHFFSPMHSTALVEIIRTPTTSSRVLHRLHEFVLKLGKTPVLVSDHPGFLVNRILISYLGEAAALVSEGLRIDLIDLTMRRFGMPMGPLQLIDQIGVDVVQSIRHVLDSVLQDRQAANLALETMANKKWLGQRTGTGFYRWRTGKRTANVATQAATTEASQTSGQQMAEISAPDEVMAHARERLLLLAVNEALACLAEGVVEDANVLDLAVILGTGWPSYRGGPVRYARQVGLSKIQSTLTEFADKFGPRYAPHPEFDRLASN